MFHEKVDTMLVEIPHINYKIFTQSVYKHLETYIDPAGIDDLLFDEEDMMEEFLF